MKNKLTVFFSDRRTIAVCWLLVALAAPLKDILAGAIDNNYLIFKYVFLHAIEQTNLYVASPHYYDTNHYGPLFSLIIAPFALLPDRLGYVLWSVGIAATLFVAIYRLPIDWRHKVICFYVLLNELFTSLASMQTNPMIAALIIGSFIAIRKERDGLAACLIMLGVFVKLYSIVGLCFFFFSRHKLRLVAYLVLWGVVFFLLPMLIASPEFIIRSYDDWYCSLVSKNVENALSSYQDISVMGMMRRISGRRELSNLLVLLPALLLFALQYLRTELYGDRRYQLAILASTLLFVVLFSSGSESPTYIIAMAGVAVWFVLQRKPYRPWVVALLVFVLLLTSFSPTDIVPRAARVFIRDHSLKALPCLMVWLTLVFQTIGSRKRRNGKLPKRNV